MLDKQWDKVFFTSDLKIKPANETTGRSYVENYVCIELRNALLSPRPTKSEVKIAV